MQCAGCGFKTIAMEKVSAYGVVAVEKIAIII